MRAAHAPRSWRGRTRERGGGLVLGKLRFVVLGEVGAEVVGGAAGALIVGEECTCLFEVEHVLPLMVNS